MENHGDEGQVFLDACCLINLFATGRARDIVAGLPYRFAVARLVAREEVLEVIGAGDEAGRVSLAPKLAALVAAGELREHDVETAEEIREMVRFARELDDGEAHTCALALCRGARVATDDRKAIRVFTAAGGGCSRTSELLFEWQERQGVDDEEVADLLRAIARRGSFLPPRQDPHFERWMGLLRKSLR